MSNHPTNEGLATAMPVSPEPLPWGWSAVEKWAEACVCDDGSGLSHPPGRDSLVWDLGFASRRVWFGDSDISCPDRIWRFADSVQRESVRRLWAAGLALGCAIDRLLEEYGKTTQWNGIEWSLILQGPLWMMAAKSPGVFQEWLVTTDLSRRKSLEQRILNVKADVWSQWFLTRSGMEDAARALWLIKSAPYSGIRDGENRPSNPGLAEILQIGHAIAASTKYDLQPIPNADRSNNDPRVALTEAKVKTLLARMRFEPPDDPILVGRSLALIRQTNRAVKAESRAADSEAVLSRIEADLDHLDDGRVVPGFSGVDSSISLENTVDSAESANQPTAITPAVAVSESTDLRWRRFLQYVMKRFDQVDEWANDIGRRRAQAESQAQAGRFESLAEFAAGAGHELNNPLAVIQGRAQLLLAKATDEQTRTSLKAIIDQTLRAHRMLRDLIFIARPSEPRPRCFRPADSLRAVVREFKPESLRRDIRLQVQVCPEAARLEIDRFDPDAFRHLCSALIRNAIEAGPDGSTVNLSLRLDQQGLFLQVEDRGRGFDTKESRHLFDPFYCGRRAGRGLGLGLPRVARVIAQMNGRVRYRSQPGQGTVFEVVLPVPRSENVAFSQSA